MSYRNMSELLVACERFVHNTNVGAGRNTNKGKALYLRPLNETAIRRVMGYTNIRFLILCF